MNIYYPNQLKVLSKKHIILLVLTCLSVSNCSYAADTDYLKQNLNDQTVYETSSTKRSLTFDRFTREGVLSDGELLFVSSYRDFKSQNGSTVLIQGSFAIYYTKGKFLGYMLKVVPIVMNTSDGSIQSKVIYPEYLDLLINGVSINKYKSADFISDNGGRCIGYSDDMFKIGTFLSEKGMPEIDVRFSLVKGGADNSIKIFSLIPKKQAVLIYKDFLNCAMEMVNQIVKDLESQK
jgi:hypothetical protein